MYLKLSVAGHLTIFLTRTRGPFWSIRPARVLWVAVLGTQIVATLIAVYGLFMTPLGWGWALFVWGYALAIGSLTLLKPHCWQKGPSILHRRSLAGPMNSTSSEAAAKALQVKTGLRQSARFGHIRRDIARLRKYRGVLATPTQLVASNGAM